MVTLVEWGILSLLTTLTGLLSAFIVWKVVKPGLERFVAAKERTIPAQMKKQLNDFMKEALEGVDLGDVAGSLGGVGAEGGGLGEIAGMLGGGGGGLQELIQLFSAFAGKGTKGKGKMGL